AVLASGESIPITRETTAALVRLVDLGAAAWDVKGARWTDALTVDAAVEQSRAETHRENEMERSRLHTTRRYAEHTSCPRPVLLTYFGQRYSGSCGTCDTDTTAVPGVPAAEPFAIGARVASEHWGAGTVQRYDGDQMTVLFDEHGYRDLL